MAAAAVLLTAAGCGASSHPAAITTTAKQPSHAAHKAKDVPPTPAARLLGLPDVGPGPVPGYILIADRDNNRLLLLSPSKRIVWRFPRPGDIRPGQSFHDPDDAFFTPGYHAISINEEFNDSASIVDVRTHRIVWSYGHPGIAGSAFGYMSNPDDAYVLPNGLVMVADIRNCRVLFIDHAKRVVRELGHAGSCAHDPPSSLSSPNGDTPLPDGGVLVTEIGGWVDRISASGRLLYSVRTPTTYPSDAQLLPGGNILVAGFDTPGRIDEITPSGRILWTYDPQSGPGALDRPSLAVRWPNGMIAVTDDWHHRVLVIDPHTKRIVWSYGHDGTPGIAAGYLNKPDGLDLLPARAAVTAAARPQRRTPQAAGHGLHARAVGTLPAALSRASAVALPGGRILVAGGLVGGSSTESILLGRPGSLRQVGRLPTPNHDAAAAALGPWVFDFGGGQATSVDTVVRIDPSTGRTVTEPGLDEPLSDLGAARVGSHVYLVGGYTGTRFATAVLRFDGSGRTTTVARLPAGLRYAGVAALGRTIYVAGGLTTAGETNAVDAVDPQTGTVRQVASLPQPIAYAPLVAFDHALYLIGGQTSTGGSLATVLRIDPASGKVTIAARLPQPLVTAAAVSDGSGITVIGGDNSRTVYAITR